MKAFFFCFFLYPFPSCKKEQHNVGAGAAAVTLPHPLISQSPFTPFFTFAFLPKGWVKVAIAFAAIFSF
jgi:hypothetical protein